MISVPLPLIEDLIEIRGRLLDENGAAPLCSFCIKVIGLDQWPGKPK